MNRVPPWFVTFVAVFAPVAIAQATKEVTIREPGKYEFAGDKASGFGVQYLVGPRATLMPKGAFLLIRKGTEHWRGPIH